MNTISVGCFKVWDYDNKKWCDSDEFESILDFNWWRKNSVNNGVAHVDIKYEIITKRNLEIVYYNAVEEDFICPQY